MTKYDAIYDRKSGTVNLMPFGTIEKELIEQKIADTCTVKMYRCRNENGDAVVIRHNYPQGSKQRGAVERYIKANYTPFTGDGFVFF